MAEEMLLAAYKAESNLRHVRNPVNFSEGRSRERDPNERPGVADSKDMFFVPLERIRGFSDELAQLSKVRFLAVVHFGQEAAVPFDAIQRAYHEVAVAARMLVITVGELAPSDTNKAQWEATIWNVGAEDDSIATVVAKAVRDLETFCRPHLIEREQGLVADIFSRKPAPRLIVAALALVALAVVVAATMFPSETIGARLRRECSSVVKAAYGPNPHGPKPKYPWEEDGAKDASRQRWEADMEDRIERCMIARGHAGR